MENDNILKCYTTYMAAIRTCAQANGVFAHTGMTTVNWEKNSQKEIVVLENRHGDVLRLKGTFFMSASTQADNFTIEIHEPCPREMDRVLSFGGHALRMTEQSKQDIFPMVFNQVMRDFSGVSELQSPLQPVRQTAPDSSSQEPVTLQNRRNAIAIR